MTKSSVQSSSSKREEELEKEIERLKEELNWQNTRNSGHPTCGGFEFYINEEWTGLANEALDAEYGWHCALRKHRIDPDDERVRIRRVNEDDAILKERDALKEEVNKLKSELWEKENGKYGIRHYAQRVGQLELESSKLLELVKNGIGVLKIISNSDSSEEGCYYTNRGNIRSAKVVLTSLEKDLKTIKSQT